MEIIRDKKGNPAFESRYTFSFPEGHKYFEVKDIDDKITIKALFEIDIEIGSKIKIFSQHLGKFIETPGYFHEIRENKEDRLGDLTIPLKIGDNVEFYLFNYTKNSLIMEYLLKKFKTGDKDKKRILTEGEFMNENHPRYGFTMIQKRWKAYDNMIRAGERIAKIYKPTFRDSVINGWLVCKRINKALYWLDWEMAKLCVFGERQEDKMRELAIKYILGNKEEI